MSQIPPPPIPPSIPTMPYSGGDFVPESQPKAWPKVVGIVSIVWGSLSLLCNGCGFVANASQEAMMNMIPKPTGPNAPVMGPMPDVMKAGIVEIAGTGLGFVLGIVLIVAGSMLVARRSASRGLHLAYAVVGALLTVAYTVFMVQKLGAMTAWAKQNPDDFWAQQSQSGFAYIGLGFGVVIGLAYPLFCLVWFGIVKKDMRELSQGVEEQVA